MTIRQASVCVALLALLVTAGCPSRSPQGTAPQASGPPPVQKEAKAQGEPLAVFAGAASKPALEELAKTYGGQTGTKVDVTFGGSGAVLTQFSQEQYGDIYVPGSDDFMDKAEKKDAVLKDTRTILVYLVPAICVAKGNPKKVKGLDDLARSDVRVVLGQPKSVCLGDIAEGMLTEVGLWSKVKPRVASFASSCEDTLNNLLLGEADAVIGWDVFARQQPEKVEAIALPAKLARPRNIPAATIKWSKQPEQAKAFVDFLASEAAKSVWSRHGYTIEPPKVGAGGR
jgi:molybdate transport system substrate-binding protein